MSLTPVDDGLYNMDGLLLRAKDGTREMEGLISRRVMDSWVDPVVCRLSQIGNTLVTTGVNLRIFGRHQRQPAEVIQNSEPGRVPGSSRSAGCSRGRPR